MTEASQIRVESIKNTIYRKSMSASIGVVFLHRLSRQCFEFTNMLKVL